MEYVGLEGRSREITGVLWVGDVMACISVLTVGEGRGGCILEIGSYITGFTGGVCPGNKTGT